VRATDGDDHPEDDAASLHTQKSDETHALPGAGPAAYLEEHIAELLAPDTTHTRLYFEPAAAGLVGARVDPDDPLAVLAHGKSAPFTAVRLAGGESYEARDPADGTRAMAVAGPEGAVPLVAPVPGTIVSVSVREGDTVRAGDEVLVMEAMKMEHVVQAHVSGTVRAITVARGDTVLEGHPLAFVAEIALEGVTEDAGEEIDPETPRPDLAEVVARQAKARDAARPDAVARRRRTGQRTARENIGDFCDAGSFVEYGPLVFAARRQRNTIQELIDTTPAGGLVMGVGRVNGHLFPDAAARCVVMSYDYKVLAGTQGKKNHQKKDRMFRLAERERLPVVFFTEGGGGRPGDTDQVFAANLHTPAFHLFGRLSGLVTAGRHHVGPLLCRQCMVPPRCIGLLAMTPTGRPSIRTRAVIIPMPKSRRSSRTEPVSARVASTERAS
jgi:biotin carboxyl carrier protein